MNRPLAVVMLLALVLSSCAATAPTITVYTTAQDNEELDCFAPPRLSPSGDLSWGVFARWSGTSFWIDSTVVVPGSFVRIPGRSGVQPGEYAVSVWLRDAAKNISCAYDTTITVRKSPPARPFVGGR